MDKVNEMILKNKIAIVTGSSRGIGKATAIALAKEGAKVVVNYLKSEDKAKEVVKEIENLGSSAIAVKTDVANAKDVERLVNETISEFGRIDILVNNAGVIVRPDYYKDLTEESWQRSIDVNLKGVFNCTKAVTPYMLKQKSGKIVNITTTYAEMGSVYVIGYTTAKAGVITLTKAFAKELAPYITVNAIAPGNIDTDMTAGAGEEFIKMTIEQTPLKRLGKPEEVADAVVFLVSPKADFITGVTLVVDGGHSLR